MTQIKSIQLLSFTQFTNCVVYYFGKKKVISGGTLFNILTRFLMRLVYGVYQLQS